MLKMALFHLLLLSGFLLSAQPEGPAKVKLSIKVEDVRSTDGTINIALYQQQHDFMSDDDLYTALKVKAVRPITTATIELPPGEYAVAIYQDEDENDEMEKNFLGIPKEPVGLSNDAIKGMSRPRFEDAAFELSTAKTVVIDLKHY